MLIVQPKKRIFVKYGRNTSGEVVRVFLLLSEIEGKIFVKVLKTEVVSRLKIKDLRFQKDAGNLICGECKRQEFPAEIKSAFRPIISPFAEYFFFTSQPTRAPSL